MMNRSIGNIPQTDQRLNPLSHNNNMQSYKLHIVSEQLSKRHPNLQPPFHARYNKTQVYMAVFDRKIPKLIEILLMENIEIYKYRDALITLNEMASNELDKDKMISEGVIGIASSFMACKNTDIRREAVLLLGSLATSSRALKLMDENTIEGISNIIFDEERSVRESLGWCICRLTLSREGVDLLCEKGIVRRIIDSFLKYSQGFNPDQNNFITYLLHAFTLILAYDNGIQIALGTGLTKRLNQLCNLPKKDQKLKEYLSLYCLSKIITNPKGKIQGINQKIIRTASNYLLSQNEEQVRFSIVIIMLTAIHLDGKKQCIYNQKGQLDTDIITKLIQLIATIEGNSRNDIIESLKIIAQLPDGLLAMTDYMSKENLIPYLEEIFGCDVVVPLAKLLPNPASIESPPVLPSAYIDQYKKYAGSLNFFLNKYQNAIVIGLEETVDIVLKLIPFVCFRGDKELQSQTVSSLTKLIERDSVARERLVKYLKKYGKNVHRITQTSLEQEIAKYPEFKEMVNLS